MDGHAHPKPAPIGLLAELTHRCPLACPYCSNPVELERASAELSGGEWQRVLSEAAALGVLQVHFSGGEPMVRRELRTLIAEAASHGLYSNLITSGALGGEREIAAFAEAGLRHDAEACREQHRELHQRPDQRHHEQGVLGLHPVGDEADDHGGDREQEEERRAQQPELLGGEAEALHADQPDHDLVGEVDEHEEEEEERDPPRALQRSIRQRPIWQRATLHCHFGVHSGWLRPLRQAVAAKKRAPAGALSEIDEANFSS